MISMKSHPTDVRGATLQTAMSMRSSMPPVEAQSAATANTMIFDLSPPNGTDAREGTELQWNDLTGTEKSAASLGVSPEAWKPISFMNTAHYETLLKTNALDSELAKRLEAFKHVSQGGS